MTLRTTALAASLLALLATAACDPMAGPSGNANPQLNNTPEGEPANATTDGISN